jgi:hypothetical protein
VDVDIERFFDEIPHEPLIEAVAVRVADGSVLRLVRLFLEALIQDGARLVSRLDRCLRGWGDYFKRAQVAGVFDRYDRWILWRLRAFVAKRWRNGLWRRYPDRYFWVHLGLTRLYRLRQDFLRDLEFRHRAGNRPVERSAGDPHATFVRRTEALS